MLAFLGELPFLVAVALAIAVVVKTFVAQAFYIPSESMVPQLLIGDRVAVSKLAYRLHEPRRGDVVVFDSPTPQPPDRSPVVRKAVRGVLEAVGVVQPSVQDYIKRVIALPGERVEGRNGRVYVNGKELVEPYLPRGVTTGDFAPQTVAPGKLWVMGDNRSRSADSRTAFPGGIERRLVVGRAFARIWPFPRTAFL